MSDEDIPPIKIAFLDVGQADTIVISCPTTHEAVVVDCVNANAVLNYLAAEKIQYLRGIIITHLHADHYGQVSSLLDNYSRVSGLQECEVVVFNYILNKANIESLLSDSDNHSKGTRRALNTFLRNLEQWIVRGSRELNLERCASLQIERRPMPIDGVFGRVIKLIHPRMSDKLGLESEGLNNTSGVLLIKGSGSSALLTGDIEPKGWQRVAVNHPHLKCDVLKFPHHGGAWNMAQTNQLLDDLGPSIVVVSVGTDNTYNHPNPEVFESLHQRPNICLLCTQATEQCGQSVLSARSAIERMFDAQSSKDGSLLMLSKRGCPCAGTVIIELSNEIRVLQPDLAFHRDSIINVHFKDHHRCHVEGPIQTDIALVETRKLLF